MLEAKKSPAFERDAKKCLKKHRAMSELKKAMFAILKSDEVDIPQAYNDHALSGDKQGFRELHVQGAQKRLAHLVRDQRRMRPFHSNRLS